MWDEYMVKAQTTKAVKKESVKAEPVHKTLSQSIWEKIKGIDLELFALPNPTGELTSSPVLRMSDTDLHLL